MIKATIILKNGVEINVITDRLRVDRSRSGKVRRIEMNDRSQFLRYVKMDEVVCVLAYPVAEKTEEQANG